MPGSPEQCVSAALLWVFTVISRWPSDFLATHCYLTSAKRARCRFLHSVKSSTYLWTKPSSSSPPDICDLLQQWVHSFLFPTSWAISVHIESICKVALTKYITLISRLLWALNMVLKGLPSSQALSFFPAQNRCFFPHYSCSHSLANTRMW